MRDPRLRSPEAVLAAPARLLICGSTAFPATCRSCWSRSPTRRTSASRRSSSARRSTCAREGFKFDLVVLNEIPTSYRQDVQDDLQRMAEASPSHAWLDRPGGLFLRRADLLTEGDRVLLRAVARAIFEGARGGLDVQMRRPLAAVGAAAEDQDEAGRACAERGLLRRARTRWCSPTASADSRPTAGNFTCRRARRRHGRTSSRTSASDSSRRIRASARRGPRTAIHNRLTPWSNDPIVDPPSEVVYLRDDKSGEFWTRNAGARGRGGEARREVRAGIRDLHPSAPRARRGAHGVRARERSRSRFCGSASATARPRPAS